MSVTKKIKNGENILWSEFQALVQNTPHIKYEELIEIHKCLNNKTVVSNCCDILNLDELYIDNILSIDDGRDYSCELNSSEIHKFVNSDYFSNCIKDFIKERPSFINIDIIASAINSDRKISEFTEREILAIYLKALEKNLKARRMGKSRDDCMENIILHLPYQLDNAQGAYTFLNNNFNFSEIMNSILESSGICCQVYNYYADNAFVASGQLCIIYEKLFRINPEAAIDFAKFTFGIPSLTLNNFVRFIYGFADSSKNQGIKSVIDNQDIFDLINRYSNQDIPLDYAPKSNNIKTIEIKKNFAITLDALLKENKLINEGGLQKTKKK